MKVLGIETSCDETSAAVILRKNNGEGAILSNIIHSQILMHQPFGGVVPEVAARAHTEYLDKIILQALAKAHLSLQEIDAIAATAGPGLLGGLLVGLTTAKALAIALKKPFIGVNHLEGHALTPQLTHQLRFPYLLLLVSGGHTQLLLIKNLGDYQRLGSTIDDALGEAFDKTAKLLGLPYPGGPAVEKAALMGGKNAFHFPRPLLHENNMHFSFSGLKTAVRQKIESLSPLSHQQISDICASFQTCIVDVLSYNIRLAFNYFRHYYPSIAVPSFVISGGVASNREIRTHLKNLCTAHNFRFIAPEPSLCTDNAAMIAWAGAQHLAAGEKSHINLPARSRWPLDETAAPLFGFGKRGTKA